MGLSPTGVLHHVLLRRRSSHPSSSTAANGEGRSHPPPIDRSARRLPSRRMPTPPILSSSSNRGPLGYLGRKADGRVPMEFKGDIPGFEAQCLREVRDSLGHVGRRDLSPFRDLLGVELEGSYPDTAVVVTYRYKASYKAVDEELQERLPSGRTTRSSRSLTKAVGGVIRASATSSCGSSSRTTRGHRPRIHSRLGARP
jgi:hypothetical protein